jgi:hypothetical protein
VSEAVVEIAVVLMLMLMFFMLEVLACFLGEEGGGRVSFVFVTMVCSSPLPPNCVFLID